MRQKQIILTTAKLHGPSRADIDTKVFPESHLAKAHLEQYLDNEVKIASEKIPQITRYIPEDEIGSRIICDKSSGQTRFFIGPDTYAVVWQTIPAEYNVSDEEIYGALDAYCNSCRSPKDFQQMAEKISANMHRYCQNELWKLIKAIIRAFAQGRYDDRNKTAHHQAQDIETFMEENNI